MLCQLTSPRASTAVASSAVPVSQVGKPRHRACGPSQALSWAAREPEPVALVPERPGAELHRNVSATPTRVGLSFLWVLQCASKWQTLSPQDAMHTGEAGVCGTPGWGWQAMVPTAALKLRGAGAGGWRSAPRPHPPAPTALTRGHCGDEQEPSAQPSVALASTVLANVPEGRPHAHCHLIMTVVSLALAEQLLPAKPGRQLCLRCYGEVSTGRSGELPKATGLARWLYEAMETVGQDTLKPDSSPHRAGRCQA